MTIKLFKGSRGPCLMWLVGTRRMRRNGIWGGHTEVLAWAYHHRRAVRVLSCNFNTNLLYNVVINPFDMPGVRPPGPGDIEEEVNLLLLHGHYYYVRALRDGEEPPMAVDGARPGARSSVMPSARDGGEGDGAGRSGAPNQQGGSGGSSHQDSSRIRWRTDAYGGRSRSDFTFNSYTARHSSTSLGGPPRPIRTLDEKALYTCMYAIFGTNWKGMVQAWRSKMIEQVGEGGWGERGQALHGRM